MVERERGTYNNDFRKRVIAEELRAEESADIDQHGKPDVVSGFCFVNPIRHGPAGSRLRHLRELLHGLQGRDDHSPDPKNPRDAK